MTLPTFIFIAGLFHFALLIASALTPQVLDWRSALAPLPKLLRQIIWVHGIFIVLTIIGFGTISLLNPAALTAGTPLARSLSAFISLFWLARLIVQFFVFDARPYLKTRFLTLGYHTLTGLFIYFVTVYAIAAIY